jgi:hypothetical protein
MSEEMWANLVTEISNTGVPFDTGLTDAEVSSAEARYGFRFPPDLRAFLQAGLPRGTRFPDWRSGDEAVLRDWLDLPRQGLHFDIEHKQFWLDEWGPRPPSSEESRRVVTGLVETAPRLIPVFAHRMMPAEPNLPGNPVLSVHQTDIIVYGVDLRDYLIHEFLARDGIGVWPIPDDIRRIPFWDSMLWGLGGMHVRQPWRTRTDASGPAVSGEL